jgi:hypothetical protein
MMRFLFKRKDGGEKSTVTGWWLIEWKSLFSIVLLKFDEGSREAYHNHAFNGLTWWLSGEVNEHFMTGEVKNWTPSFWPKYTPRACLHKVFGVKTAYALSFRGPWKDTWQEYLPKEDKFVTLTHGRKQI